MGFLQSPTYLLEELSLYLHTVWPMYIPKLASRWNYKEGTSISVWEEIVIVHLHRCTAAQQLDYCHVFTKKGGGQNSS